MFLCEIPKSLYLNLVNRAEWAMYKVTQMKWNKLPVAFLCTAMLLLLPVFLSPAWGESSSAGSAAIASAHPLATAAGEKILKQGGNAFDAAVAVSAVLAVVEPHSSGLGGGGFWLLHRASDKRDVMIDGRETAPGKASAGMYLDTNGKPVAGASLQGPLAAAIPGSPAALAHIAKKYGSLPLARSLSPAITLARHGFKVDQRLAQTIRNHRDKLLAYDRAAHIFLNNGLAHEAPIEGAVLRQPQLAATLTEIARHGHNGFYHGRVADDMIQSVKRAGGIWEREDLARYRVIEREPVRFSYRGATVTSASLPSSGGLTLAQALNILENFQLKKLSQTDKAHLIAEALRRAYQDRAQYLGDSDFVTVPAARLMSKDYGRERAKSIDLNQATPDIGSGNASAVSIGRGGGGTETTHFSIMDREGNRVAATMSINTFFGSGFVAGNTGVLLNNEMDDFSIAPGLPNVYGLRGNAANAIAPGKRPLSSMSPTFVENEQGILITGTPGGSRIISMLLLAIIDTVDGGQVDPDKIVSNPRFHHQYLPNQIEIEPDSFSEDWVSELDLRGHMVKTATRKWGNMQLLFFDKKKRRLFVASDPRGATSTRY